PKPNASPPHTAVEWRFIMAPAISKVRLISCQEAEMLHTLQPPAFGVPQALQTSCKCPECDTPLLYGNGIMGFAHYLDGNDQVAKGLVCFCSMTCLLEWEPSSMLGLMH